MALSPDLFTHALAPVPHFTLGRKYNRFNSGISSRTTALGHVADPPQVPRAFPPVYVLTRVPPAGRVSVIRQAPSSVLPHNLPPNCRAHYESCSCTDFNVNRMNPVNVQMYNCGHLYRDAAIYAAMHIYTSTCQPPYTPSLRTGNV